MAEQRARSDDALQALRIVQHVVERDHAAHAVADQKHRKIWLLLVHQVQKGLNVPTHLGPTVNTAPLSRRATVPPQVEGIDGISPGHEPIDHVAIAATMLSEAMDDGQSCPGPLVGPPTLVVEFCATLPFQGSFGVVHILLSGSGCAHSILSCSDGVDNCWASRRGRRTQKGKHRGSEGTAWQERRYQLGICRW
jgi:hypothetical protein